MVTQTTEYIALDQISLQSLKSSQKGSVLAQGNSTYEEARMAWNLSVQHHSTLIMTARTAYDISPNP